MNRLAPVSLYVNKLATVSPIHYQLAPVSPIRVPSPYLLYSSSLPYTCNKKLVSLISVSTSFCVLSTSTNHPLFSPHTNQLPIAFIHILTSPAVPHRLSTEPVFLCMYIFQPVSPLYVYQRAPVSSLHALKAVCPLDVYQLAPCSLFAERSSIPSYLCRMIITTTCDISTSLFNLRRRFAAKASNDLVRSARAQRKSEK